MNFLLPVMASAPVRARSGELAFAANFASGPPGGTQELGNEKMAGTPVRRYASAGVKECWLVLGPEKQIEVHRQPQGGQFAQHALHGPGGPLTSAVVPGFTIELVRLFAA